MLGCLHCFANAMRHEPSRLIGDTKRTVELMGADALFASVDERERHQPLIERDFAVFKDGSDRNGELLTASVALVQAGAGGLRREACNMAVFAAMGADGTVRPVDGF